VQWRGKSILVDTPPEFRLQSIRSHLQRVDLLLYTHSHADHIFGLDDVRRYNEMQGVELPIYSAAETLEDLKRSFRYVFVPTQLGGGKPKLALTPIEGDRVNRDGLEIEAIPIWHGKLPVLGFRFGNFAYVTDTSEIPASSMERLRGLDTLILGALRWEEHPTHFNIDQALAVVAELKPRRTFFTHIAHTVGHRETEARLPSGVRLAYDGLVLDLPD
jgi:phosphoribosyl 1,2-cyclic phosphate phosphodiesterase